MKNFIVVSFNHQFRAAKQGNKSDLQFSGAISRAWYDHATVEGCGDTFDEAVSLADSRYKGDTRLEVFVFTCERIRKNTGEIETRNLASYGIRTGLDGKPSCFVENQEQYANAQ